jgi:anaerobic magnesium-protoporphyrin IX monomethyl ester cyclase
VKVGLVYPPTCDPTAPYLSVPTLTGFLRSHGVEVVPVDANVEAWDRLLRRDALAGCAAELERRLAELEARPTLGHREALDHATLWRARGDALAAPGAIDDAVALLRGQRGDFFDPAQYAEAVAAVDAAQRLVSAAHAPLTVDFTAYRTPFSLLTADEIAADAARDPFRGYYQDDLVPRLAGVDMVGISVAFPGQLQPAYTLAHVLRAARPDLHLVVGGPAITQILVRLKGEALERALRPFDAAIVFEGEQALLDETRAPRRGLVRGVQIEDMGILPPPDFDGLPLAKYLTPEVVLPYDPTRGCYWGVCTFCHYGLAEVGTARYRERPIEVTMRHLRGLHEKHGTRVFYLSQDSVSPKTALRIARAVREEGLPWRWATDMRPERSLSPARAAELAQGGCLAMALGVESAAPRVLELIDKGVPVETVGAAIDNLAGAGIAVEAMAFTDFPTETTREALATLRFIEERRRELALFICGEFDLTHGALVAQRPGDFGIAETWQLEGDELGTGLFYEEQRPSKSEEGAERVDAAVARLSGGWLVRRYPWAGAVSTAHTLLHYERFGPAVFKDPSRSVPGRVRGARPATRRARFDVLGLEALEREAGIWHHLVRERRQVSRALYEELAAALPRARPRPGAWRVLAGHEPVPVGDRLTPRPGRPGRRPSHATSATKGS